MGRETESEGEHSRREVTLPQEALPEALSTVRLGPHRMDPPALHQPLLGSTLIVDDVLEPPFCSQSLFLLMSPATISWGQRGDTSQGQKPWALLSESPGESGERGPVCLHLADQPALHSPPRPGPAG